MRSKGEERVYRALETLGAFRIREQYSIGGLRVDFVILELRLAVEYDGSQHYEYNAHFHDSKDAFRQAQERDRRKEALLAEAGFTLVRLNEQHTKTAKDADSLAKEILSQAAQSRYESQKDIDTW